MGGFCASVPHAAGLLPPSWRFHLTAEGLRRLAGEEGMAPDELLRDRPASSQWRRSLMERLDALDPAPPSPPPSPASPTPFASAGIAPYPSPPP